MLGVAEYFSDLFNNPTDLVFYLSILSAILIVIIILVACKISSSRKAKKNQKIVKGSGPTDDTIVINSAESFKEADAKANKTLVVKSNKVEETAEEPVEEVTEEPAEEVTEEPVEEVAEEPAEEVAEETTEEVAEETTEEVTEEPVEEVAEETTEEVTEESVEEVAEDSAEEVAEDSTEEVTEEPAEEVAEEPVEEVAEETVKKPAKKTTATKKTTAAKKTTTAKKTTAAKKTTTANKTEAETPVEEKKGRQYNGKYEVYQDAEGYRYRLKASNGEVLVVSESYTTREGVGRAIDAVKRNVETGEVKVFADKRGQFKFKLSSRNYRVLAVSANYSTEKGANRAAESFKKFALKADIVEIELVDTDAATATLIDVVREDKQGGKFEVSKFNGEFSWDLKASNGQILCQADGYTTKAGALNSIDTFKKNIENGTFKCVKDKNNRYCFKLYSAVGRVCAVGESYPTKASAESAATSVCSFYKNAEIVELKEDEIA